MGYWFIFFVLFLGVINKKKYLCSYKIINEDMPQEQTNIKERTKQELKEPDMYKVIMHNDDFTTMDFVVMVLKTVFYKDEATAHKLMLTVHKQGKAQIGLYTLDIAVSKCQRAMTMARKEGFPFLVTWEPDR